MKFIAQEIFCLGSWTKILAKISSDRDLTNKIITNSGQAEKFAQFINNQVIPLIDEKFRVSQDRTLIGHSFAGVFTTFMLLCYPKSFTKHIAITPVLTCEYYTEKAMFNVLKQIPSTTKKLAYFSIGGEEKDHRIKNYVAILKQACLEIGKLPNIHSKVEVIDGENHASVVTPSIWRGLNFFNINQ